MIKSMTGYGKSEANLENGKLTVEIRTLNSKSCDICIKTFLLPKEKDLMVRKKIADALQRGTIDVFLTWEPKASDSAKQFNKEIAHQYLAQLKDFAHEEMGFDTLHFTPESASVMLTVLMKMPDVIEAQKSDVITEENWPVIENAFDDCLQKVNSYRDTEGKVLYNDVTSRVNRILEISKEVEQYESERILAVRERIMKGFEDFKQNTPERERFEQDLVFYLEKLDISEERVRLRQHCKYFMDTIDNEPCPGKKLGFILQEMGREINTTGSKANHASMQKCVVLMKDELEKIREQSMNIL